MKKVHHIQNLKLRGKLRENISNIYDKAGS